MDPITLAMVAALATGAATGVASSMTDIVGKKGITDAYDAFKAMLKKKYGKDSDLVEAVEGLEKQPASKDRQDGLQKEVATSQADQDEDVLRQAQALLDAIQKHAPEAAAAVGVNLEDFKGASLKIEDIIATGTGVDVKKADISGDIEIKGVRAGKGGDTSKKP